MKIVAFHIYNDYSGSPKVLSMVLKGLLARGYQVDLLTSNTGGVLNELEKEEKFRVYHHYYKFGDNFLLQFLRYLYTQLYGFFFVLRYFNNKNVILYLNTLMPLGAALAGKLIGKKVIYHYHENANVKGWFYRCLAYLMQKLADEIICVSEYQRSFLKRENNVCVIPNALPVAFENACMQTAVIERDQKSVLMLSSLKAYKGIAEFFKLAQRLSNFHFELVINDTGENIKTFIEQQKLIIPENLTIWDRQSDVIPFYKRSSVVVNLSKKQDFVETFGLTALEAMTAGVPVVVPTIGGIAEMVMDGYNGYKVDVEDFEKLVEIIKLMLVDKDEYKRLRKNARAYALKYSNKSMIDKIEQTIKGVYYE